MVYVEKFEAGGNFYYKLVHTLRKGKKITHRTRYLGKSLPGKEELGQLEKEFLRELREERYEYLSLEEVESIEHKKEKYQEDIGKLSFLEEEERLKEFVIRFTYDSSKLSGVRVTLRQTSLILREGIMPKGFKNLRTVKELENHEKGIMAITKYKGVLNEPFIKKLHKILFLGVDDTIAGKLRSELKRNVKIAGTSYVPPNWENLSKELENFFRWYRADNRKLHPLELAALIHLKLISIQPFVDGNSRLSRLMMNRVLWKKGYPPVDIPVEELENYYNVLDKYQIEKNEKPFVDYIKKRYLKSS